MMESWFQRMGLGERGENWTTFGASFSTPAQIAWVENLTANLKPDWIMIQSASTRELVEPAEEAIAQGIPVFTFDCGIDSDYISSFIAHKFEGPGGTDVLGEWLVKELWTKGYGPGNPAIVIEMWGHRGLETSRLRHQGFHSAVDSYPWIIVLETIDTHWREDLTAEILTNITNPELWMEVPIIQPITPWPPSKYEQGLEIEEIAAIWHHGCGGSGMITGLSALDMLLPVGDPDHIIIVSNDCEIALWDGVIDGTVDAFSTHGAVEPTDVCFQVAITHVVLGRDVKSEYQCPFLMVTQENIDTVQIGGVPPYPGWPRGQYHLWMPMDPEEEKAYGFPQPTVKLRDLYQGY